LASAERTANSFRNEDRAAAEPQAALLGLELLERIRSRSAPWLRACTKRRGDPPGGTWSPS